MRKKNLALTFAACLLMLPNRASEAQIVWKHFRGMCDASALEMLSDDLFVVGNDEDNILRVYSRTEEGLPLQELDFSGFYGLKKRTKEIDLEGAARIGDRIYWISSHGANAKGKYQPTRHRLFATQILTNGGRVQLRPSGRLYTSLVRDLVSTPELVSLNLRTGSLKAPKTRNALNIEGLAPTPDGKLLIGFRNPVPEGKALIIPLLNPEAVTAGRRGEFGEPSLLDLGGLGIKSLAPYRNGYLIVAGSFDGGGSARLFFWDGINDKPEAFRSVSLPGNPEGIAILTSAQGDKVFALSDDGTLKVGAIDCKKLKDDSLKQFRGYELPLDSRSALAAEHYSAHYVLAPKETPADPGSAGR